MSNSSGESPPRLPWSVPALVDGMAPDLRALEDFRVQVVAKRKQGYFIFAMCGLICGSVARVGLTSAIIASRPGWHKRRIQSFSECTYCPVL